MENIGIEIEKPVYSPYEITEEDIILIEKSSEDKKKGNIKECSEVTFK